MKLKIATAILGLAAMSNVNAEQCPEVSQISQTALPGGGFEYKAPLLLRARSLNGLVEINGPEKAIRKNSLSHRRVSSQKLLIRQTRKIQGLERHLSV